MVPFDDWRFEQARRTLSGTLQNLVKLLQGLRIQSQFRVGMMDGAVRAPPLIPNKMFRPRHKLLLFSKTGERAARIRAAKPHTKTKRPATAGRGPPVFLSGLDNREEHHPLMIVHLEERSANAPLPPLAGVSNHGGIRVFDALDDTIK